MEHFTRAACLAIFARTPDLYTHVSSTLKAEPTETFYVLSYGCDPRNVSRVRSIIERDLTEMQTGCVPEEALNLAKVLLLKQIPFPSPVFTASLKV